jgi:NTP pyrophosphatase (non-canonical NTP hydrolase)
MTRTAIIGDLAQELERAYRKHGRAQWGRHEFYAIMLEEVDEAWDAIKSDAPQHELEKELLQIAAMCVRYLETGDRYREAAETETAA